MKDSDEEVILHYQQLYEKFGQSYEALNWGSQYSQYLRFKIISEMVNLEGKSILDVGCGLGDFAGWLNSMGISVIYTGLDFTPGLINQAVRNYPTSNFIHGSILDQSLMAGMKFDIVIASGIFYTYSADGNAWFNSAVSRMWTLCNEGIVFNSLSDWSDKKDRGEYYADPIATIEFCKNLTSFIALRHDYHPRDFTVSLLKRPRE